nr:immunoglobulin heavy chain junction region [Macaca mulatta]MOV35632.1 immunoglobulin heavy chain junction region [Macaca mulatta]
CTGRKGGFDYW